MIGAEIGLDGLGDGLKGKEIEIMKWKTNFKILKIWERLLEAEDKIIL